MNNPVCPHCGGDLKKLISRLMSENGKKGGSSRSEKKAAAGKANMEKLNASYTAARRAIAARKRLATLARKKAAASSGFWFRWHRGDLAESMASAQEFASYEDLLKFVQDDMRDWGVAVNELAFEYIGFDDRTGWDTWYVLVDGHCVGMANKNPVL